MTTPQPDQQVIPLAFDKGAWMDGDPGLLPDGYAREMTNMVLSKAGVWTKRPAMVAEPTIPATLNFVGYVNWDDYANFVTRLIAFDSGGSQTAVNLYVKDIGAETYGSAISGTTFAIGTTNSPSDYTNYRGVLYYSMAQSANGSLNPLGTFSYNGAASAQINTAPFGGETLYSLTLKAFNDRIFLGYVVSSVVNKLGTTTMYDPTSWSNVTTTTTNLTNSTSITGRITPTATTLSQIYKANVYTVAASTTPTSLVYRADLRSVSPTNNMPLKVEIYYSQIWVANTAYALGAIRVPTAAAGNGFRYRVTVAGTSANPTEPTWPTTVGSTVVDNTVTWINDGPDQIASTEPTLPSLNDQPNFSTYWATTTIPPMPAASNVGVRIKFGNTATPTITLNPIDISFKDGVTDGVTTKANFGQQLTVGKFRYPFVNTESSATATVNFLDDLYWTEVADPNTIRAVNTYRLRERPGRVTAMAVCAGRLIVFKERAMWVFQGTTDPDIPIVRERFFDGIGCIGPRALTVFEDTVYFIGRNEAYSFTPGGKPVPLAGPRMGETIFVDPLRWTSDDRMRATVAVDEIRKNVWFSIDQARAHVFNIEQIFNPDRIYTRDRNAWSIASLTQGGGASEAAISRLIWNPERQSMYGDGGGNPCRFSYLSGTASPDSLVGSDTASIASIQFRPIEQQNGREDICLDAVVLYVQPQAAQASYTFKATATVYSVAGGAQTAQTKTNTVTLTTVPTKTSEPARVVIPLRQQGPNILIKIQHTGDAGQGAFALTRAEAIVRGLRPERTTFTPAQVSNTL